MFLCFQRNFNTFSVALQLGRVIYYFNGAQVNSAQRFIFNFVCGPCWEETRSNQVPSLHEENLPKSRYTKKSDQWLNTAFIIVNGALFNYEKKYLVITPYCYHDYLLSSQHSNQVLNETAFGY